jgi:hypothetical protein
MIDESMLIDNILPNDFGEDMESVWSSERSVDEVREDLLARGFQENKKFSNFMNNKIGDDEEDFDDEDNE